MSGRAPAGAWGKAPSEAVRAAPPVTPSPARQNSGRRQQQQQQQQLHQYGGGLSRGGGGGRGRGGGGRGGRGRGGNQQDRRGSGRGGGGGGHQNKSKTNLANVKLCQDGTGKTDAQKQVKRYDAQVLLQLRLVCLDPREDFHPPEAVAWTDDGREDAIVAFHNARRKGGDVTPRPPKRPPPKDTAPPLEECEPIQINEETRWKAKHMDDSLKEDEDSDEALLKKALYILNKLSLTTFDKLSKELVDLGIARNEACLKGVIELIVENAHVQPHFASMYALLCAQLSAWQVGGKKVFKKLLLTQCQVEFEKDTSAKVQEMIANIQDEEEREYQAALIKKNYLGHMRFIGELYKNDMIKIDIMLWCLKTLLEDDEEQLECFAKLMTTSGGSLEQQALALRDTAGKPASWEQLQECWKVVEQFSKKGPNARIRFMLLDLLELRENGWVERRQKETAKTMDQIRKEHAKEERNRGKGLPAKPTQGLGRRSSTGDVRILDRKPVVDSDGFTQVARTNSTSNIMGGSSSLAMAATGKQPRPSANVRRSVSLPQVTATEKQEAAAAPAKSFPPADECGEKTKKILKEYFVGGDTDDAVLSIDEIVGFGHDGSIDRGAKVIEGGTLMVLEMKEDEVNKFLTILLRCLKENKIQRKSVATGMNDPLEFLGDIEIDAPLARKHLVHIVAELMKANAVDIDFLLEAPEYFRDEGKAASFAAKVLKATGEEVTDADVALIEQLMTEDDKTAHATARALFDSV